MPIKTLGIWIGFDTLHPLRREGISRFLLYLTKGLLKNYALDIEIWCYECNYMEVRELFLSVTEDPNYSRRVLILTENSNDRSHHDRWSGMRRAVHILHRMIYYETIFWKEPSLTYREFAHFARKVGPLQLNQILATAKDTILLPFDWFIELLFLSAGFSVRLLGKLRIKKAILSLLANLRRMMRPPAALNESGEDRLTKRANECSSSDCFLIYVATLTNGLGLKPPKIVFLPDLVMLAFREYFIAEDPNSIAWIESIRTTIEKYVMRDSFFCSISDYGMRQHLLSFVPSVREDRAAYIYLASMMPDNLSNSLIKEKMIRERFGIMTKYLFYPTQIRPYKNLITVLKAMRLVLDRGIDLLLVLTGRLENDSKAHSYAKQYGLLANVIQCGDVAEYELYSLYRAAEMTVSSSLFEGGFPLQALESFLVNTPVVLSRIPPTVERIRHEGFDPNSCGLRLFDPTDEVCLANNIVAILDNRDKAIAELSEVRSKLLAYTWDHVSHQYYHLFSSIIREKQSPSNPVSEN